MDHPDQTPEETWENEQRRRGDALRRAKEIEEYDRRKLRKTRLTEAKVTGCGSAALFGSGLLLLVWQGSKLSMLLMCLGFAGGLIALIAWSLAPEERDNSV